MSEPKVIEVQSDDPAINASLAIAVDLAKRGYPFVAVPCVTPEQGEAARELGLKHIAEIRQVLSTSH